MLEFTLRVKNAKSLSLAFGGLVAKVRDWRPLWPQVIEEIQQVDRAMFMSRGNAGAIGQWAGYKHTYGPDKREGEPASLRSSAELGRRFEGKLSGKGGRKRKAKFRARAEQADRLYRSLTEKTKDTLEVLQPLRMQFGTAVPYATYHQTGTKYMEARRLFDFTDAAQGNIRRAIQREAVNFSRRLGFKVIAEAGGDVSEFSLGEIRQAGVSAMNASAPMDWSAPLW